MIISDSLAHEPSHDQTAAQGQDHRLTPFRAGHSWIRPGVLAEFLLDLNVSGADPVGTLRMYGEHVLPALRG